MTGPSAPFAAQPLAGFVADLCDAVCRTLLHSLWQFAALATVLYLVERTARLSMERRSAIASLLLAVGLAALPATFAVCWTAWESADHAPRTASTRSISSAEPSGTRFPIDEGLPSNAMASPTGPGSTANPLTGSPPVGDPVVTIGSLTTAPHNDVAGWSLWIAAGWLIGVAVMLCRVSIAAAAAARLRRGASRLRFNEIGCADELVRLLPSLGEGTRRRLAVSDRVRIPQVSGLLRPMILLPVSAATGLSGSQLQAIIAHELVHIRRHDLWVNAAQRLAEAVLFFNPFLWMLSRQITRLREHACDDATVRLLTTGGTDQSHDLDSVRETVAVRYADALIASATLSYRSASERDDAGLAKMTTLAAAGASPSELRRRVARLLGEPIRQPAPFGGRLTRLSLLAIILSIGVAATTWANGDRQTEDDRQSTRIERPKPTDVTPQAAPDEATESDGTESDGAASPDVDQAARAPWIEVIAIGTHSAKGSGGGAANGNDGNDENDGDDEKSEDETPLWWTATGEPIDEAELPFVYTSRDTVSLARAEWRRVVFVVHDATPDQIRSLRVLGAKATAIDELTDRPRSETGQRRRSLGEISKDGWPVAMHAGFLQPPEDLLLNVTMKVPDGPWQTNVEHGEGGRYSMGGAGQKELSFITSGGDPSKGENGEPVTAVVGHESDIGSVDVRIVAVDADGNATPSSGMDMIGVSGMRRYEARFPAEALESLHHYEVQTRPLRTIIGKGVPFDSRPRPLERDRGADAGSTASAVDAKPAAAPVSHYVITDDVIFRVDDGELRNATLSSWEQIDADLAAAEGQTHLHLAMTNGFYDKAGASQIVRNRLRSLREKHELTAISQSSVSPGIGRRYDAATTPEDLLANSSRQVEWRVEMGDEPAGGIEVLLVTGDIAPVDPIFDYDIYLVEGRVRQPYQHEFTRTDDDGRFTIHPPNDEPYVVVLVHPELGLSVVPFEPAGSSNAAEVSEDDDTLWIRQWASLAVTMPPGSEPPSIDTKFAIDSLFPTGSIGSQLGMAGIQFVQDRPDKKIGTDRTYRFDRVPGWATTTISHVTPLRDSGYETTPAVNLHLVSGESREVPIGPMSEMQRSLLEVNRAGLKSE